MYAVSGFSRGCEQITFNAETAEAAEKKCLKISLRALRALRSNVVFFHRLFRRTVCGSEAAVAAHAIDAKALPRRPRRRYTTTDVTAFFVQSQSVPSVYVRVLRGKAVSGLASKPRRSRREIWRSIWRTSREVEEPDRLTERATRCKRQSAASLPRSNWRRPPSSAQPTPPSECLAACHKAGGRHSWPDDPQWRVRDQGPSGPGHDRS